MSDPLPKKSIRTLIAIFKYFNLFLLCGALLCVAFFAVITFLGEPYKAPSGQSSDNTAQTSLTASKLPSIAGQSASQVPVQDLSSPLDANQDLSAQNAVFFLADKSRSTAFDGQIELEREIIQNIVNGMYHDDIVSVIGFDTTPFVVVKPEKVSAVLPILDYRLKNLVPLGKTDLLSALHLLGRTLPQVKAKKLHIFILSDGKIPVSGNEYVDKIKELTDQNASISTIGIGNERDEAFLKNISQIGKGEYRIGGPQTASQFLEIFRLKR